MRAETGSSMSHITGLIGSFGTNEHKDVIRVTKEEKQYVILETALPCFELLHSPALQVTYSGGLTSND